MHERTKVKNTNWFWSKIKKLVYDYCQWWERYKSQITDSKNSMVGISQNRQEPCFYCGPLEKVQK